MIKRDYYETRSDGVKLYRTYSDSNYMIKKVGTEEVYEEAIDVENALYEYEELDQKIGIEEAISETELKAQAYDIIVGEVE
jgi:hypothetical protein